MKLIAWFGAALVTFLFLGGGVSLAQPSHFEPSRRGPDSAPAPPSAAPAKPSAPPPSAAPPSQRITPRHPQTGSGYSRRAAARPRRAAHAAAPARPGAWQINRHRGGL